MLKNKELARKAFIDPVRSVLFIDDQFPTYEELCEGGDHKRNEVVRARSLVSSCRRHNYVCDVQNNPDLLQQIEMDRIGVSDLIVVDYHLRGVDQHNDDALNFLARLARSPHFNLAVVYTGEANLKKVRLCVAARLRGDPVPQKPDETAGELPEISIDLRLVEAHVEDYLRNPRQLCGKVPVLFPNETDEVRALGARQHALIRRNFEAYLADKMGTANYAGPKNHLEIVMSAEGQTEQWVQAGNVFVAIVPKDPAEKPESADIQVLIQKLNDCIVAWSPSLIDVMLTAAAGSMIRHGLRQLTGDFADASLRSGLVYWFLAGDSAYGDFGAKEAAGDRRARIEVLYRAVFELLSTAAMKQAADLTEEIVKAELGDKDPIELDAMQHFALAKEWSKTAGVEDEKMMLAANSFLCSSAFDSKHVTTGTVFRRVGADEYWLCVSAACDMVPRGKSMNEWREKMFPLRMLLGARLKKVAPGGILETAYRGKHVFVRLADGVIVLEFISNAEPEPQLVPLFAGNAAQVDAGRFTASMLSKKDDGALGVESLAFEPVAQLRENYASRLLQQSGQHLFRIGVDFLSRRKPTQKKAAAAPNVTAAAPKAAAAEPEAAAPTTPEIQPLAPGSGPK